MLVFKETQWENWAIRRRTPAARVTSERGPARPRRQRLDASVAEEKRGTHAHPACRTAPWSAASLRPRVPRTAGLLLLSRKRSGRPSRGRGSCRPARTCPARIAFASGFSICCWIARFSGRAPYTGSKPAFATSLSAASVTSSSISILRRRSSSSFSWIRAMVAMFFSSSAWNTTISSMRLTNSGRKWVFTSPITASLTTPWSCPRRSSAGSSASRGSRSSRSPCS